MSSATPVSRADPQEIEALVREILDYEKGEVCFLCSTTAESECLWDEIGDEIIKAGETHLRELENSGSEIPFGLKYKQARYHCYQHYIFKVSNWVPSMGCIRLPLCVEGEIKRVFVGDGHFVGFKSKEERDGSNRN